MELKKRVIRKRNPVADQSRYYIDKDEYTAEVINYKKTGKASERLGELFTIHVDKYASSLSFKNYTYLDEMKSQSKLFLLKYSTSFNPDYATKNNKKMNAFAYCTSIIYNAFLQVIQREKKHSALKDKLIKNSEKINHELEKFNSLNQITIDD